MRSARRLATALVLVVAACGGRAAAPPRPPVIEHHVDPPPPPPPVADLVQPVRIEQVPDDNGEQGGVVGGIGGDDEGGLVGGVVGGVVGGEGDTSGVMVGGVVGGYQGPTPPPPPPPPPSPTNIAPTLLEGQRIAGDREIAPDDDTKRAIARAGVTNVIASFKLCVAGTGDVAGVTLLRSSHFPDYDAKLERGIRTWRYRPYRINGKVAAVCTAVTFIYRQDPPPPPPPPAP